ncbi:hypothetical protein VCH24_51750 [Variovorax boronicumulans]|nr:hypothetical protein VCH24_51750 [Variovorax boronicumulans]
MALTKKRYFSARQIQPVYANEACCFLRATATPEAVARDRDEEGGVLFLRRHGLCSDGPSARWPKGVVGGLRKLRGNGAGDGGRAL